MYFVTSKKPGYVLFCMTPSGRAAIGLGEDKMVRLFARERSGEWRILQEWKVTDRSHTDVMIELGEHDEPADPNELVAILAR